jgi:hypothetical protein
MFEPHNFSNMTALQLGEMKRKEIYIISVMLSYKVYHLQNGHFHPCKREKQEMYAQKNNSCCSFPFVYLKM